jgi:hypothetical protein
MLKLQHKLPILEDFTQNHPAWMADNLTINTRMTVKMTQSPPLPEAPDPIEMPQPARMAPRRANPARQKRQKCAMVAAMSYAERIKSAAQTPARAASAVPQRVSPSRQPSPGRQSGPIQPGQTQPASAGPTADTSHLVKPSPTFHSTVRAVRVRPVPTQYGLIRPNTAKYGLKCFMKHGFLTKCQSNGPESPLPAAPHPGPAAAVWPVDWLASRPGTGTMAGPDPSLRPRSSDGQSSGFLRHYGHAAFL